ncbi:type IV pilus assembly protein PilV [Microbulbifer donghaiensis]|uniref:Type IV pilus assembly protein PilV n=1 Tax=Microbulbifer donghaiensis TaxID=494016 RepID=A0A1M5HWD4_9GAMM|nr:type IV pilus modification protein PilV [Microbulbifer donghaiensis]SHG20250.1 type IV pilus assembly protein PilV [Microbulbifer donghaiensis]
MKQQTGATMIEILVTILVLAVGLLGLSATQVMSLKNGNNAHHRYMAALAAHEMAERMRANPDGLELGSYDGETVDGSETTPNCSATLSCSAGDLADLDLYDWGQVISDNLPSGTGQITRAVRTVTLTVSWNEQHTGENRGTAAGGLENSTFEMVVEL